MQRSLRALTTTAVGSREYSHAFGAAIESSGLEPAQILVWQWNDFVRELGFRPRTEVEQ